MKLIIQIARLDRNYNNDVVFKIKNDDGTEYESSNKLSSLFLYEYFKKKNEQIKILFIFPESLPLQNFTGTEDKYLQEILQMDDERYINDPDYLINIVKKHPHINGNDFVVVNSIGKYKREQKEFTFDSSLELITLQIFTHLVKNYKNVDEICLDISAGQNTNILAAFNAIINFKEYYDLFNKYNKTLNISIFYSDPILSGITNSVNINKFEINKSSSFSWPINDKKYESYLNTILEKYKLESSVKDFYVCMKFLYYSFENGFILELCKLINKNYSILDDVINQIINSFNYSYRKINSSDFLNKELISEGISFYNFLLDIFKIYAFIRVTSDYKTFFKEEFELRGKKNDLITSEDIKNVFIKMGFYKAYGEFKREIKYLFNLIDINLISDEFINVAEILDKNYKKSDFNERNYISHSGLEKNSVLIRKCNDIYFMKSKDCIQEKYKDILSEIVKK